MLSVACCLLRWCRGASKGVEGTSKGVEGTSKGVEGHRRLCRDKLRDFLLKYEVYFSVVEEYNESRRVAVVTSYLREEALR